VPIMLAESKMEQLRLGSARWACPTTKALRADCGWLSTSRVSELPIIDYDYFSLNTSVPVFCFANCQLLWLRSSQRDRHQRLVVSRSGGPALLAVPVSSLLPLLTPCCKVCEIQTDTNSAIAACLYCTIFR